METPDKLLKHLEMVINSSAGVSRLRHDSPEKSATPTNPRNTRSHHSRVSQQTIERRSKELTMNNQKPAKEDHDPGTHQLRHYDKSREQSETTRELVTNTN